MEYLMILLIVNSRLFCRIANSLEDGCLPGIGTANDKDTKTRAKPSNISCSSLLSLHTLEKIRHLSLGMPEMVDVMKNQDGQIVWLHVSQTSDVTHSLHAAEERQLIFVFSFIQLYFP